MRTGLSTLLPNNFRCTRRPREVRIVDGAAAQRVGERLGSLPSRLSAANYRVPLTVTLAHCYLTAREFSAWAFAAAYRFQGRRAMDGGVVERSR